MLIWGLTAVLLLSGAYLVGAYLLESPRRTDTGYLTGGLTFLGFGLLFVGTSLRFPWSMSVLFVAAALVFVGSPAVRGIAARLGRRLRSAAPPLT